MMRKTYILSLIMLLVGFALCFTNGFADENPEGIDENNKFAED